MLAYFDASGSMGNSPVFVMAGYVGRFVDWKKFTPEWQTGLDTPKAIDYFKMSEAWARRGEFQGWHSEDRDARLRLLAPIVNKHALAAVVSVIPVKSWKQHFVGRLEKTYHNRPYYFAFHGVISNAIKYMHAKGIKEKIDCIFDSEGGEPIAEIIDGFSRFAELAPDHLKEYIGDPPTFRDEKKILPLQAADLLAWHVRRVYAERAQGEEAVRALTPIAGEVFNIEHAYTVWKDHELKDAIRFIENRSKSLALASRKPIPMTIPDPTSRL